jgi:hypothetical protein
MTIFEKFAKFAERLPEDRRQVYEELLADLMAGEGAESELSAEEMAEIKRRLADPDPEYVDSAEIDAMLAHDDD